MNNTQIYKQTFKNTKKHENKDGNTNNEQHTNI